MAQRTPRHLVAVVGARPNFVKMSALVTHLREDTDFHVTLVHTRQHHDERLSEVFFRQLEIPRPDFSLEIPGGGHAAQTADTMREFDRTLDGLDQVNVVVVVGDVNSTLAASLVAVKRGIPVAHVEAGLRSYNWAMPEEINRVVTDRISDVLLTPSEDADENLLREGIPAERIHRVGNVMIDTLLKHRAKARAFESAKSLGLESRGYAVVTLHRQENVDQPAILENLIATLGEIGKSVPIVLPLHPRTQKRLEEFELTRALEQIAGIRLVSPMGYLEFLDLLANAKLVLTDSGGLQEETTVLGVPCLTLRGETERPVTVTHGTNRVVGTDRDAILRAAGEILEAGEFKPSSPPLWDGHAAERVAKVLDRVIP